MDDDAKEALKIATEVALSPVTKVIDTAIGLGGGDWLAALRDRQRQKYRARTEETASRTWRILDERAVKETAQRNDAAVLDIVVAAQEEGRDELRELWARLLAAVLDPARAASFRREFVDIAKQLEPLDAAVLPVLNVGGMLAPNRKEHCATKFKCSTDEVENSFRNLLNLGLVWRQESNPIPANQPFTTALGKQFLRAVE